VSAIFCGISISAHTAVSYTGSVFKCLKYDVTKLQRIEINLFTMISQSNNLKTRSGPQTSALAPSDKESDSAMERAVLWKLDTHILPLLALV
jgi:hypothetical protein